MQTSQNKMNIMDRRTNSSLKKLNNRFVCLIRFDFKEISGDSPIETGVALPCCAPGSNDPASTFNNRE